MVMEELYSQVISDSLMDNGKMEYNMDTLDLLDKMVGAVNMNVKMVIM